MIDMDLAPIDTTTSISSTSNRVASNNKNIIPILLSKSSVRKKILQCQTNDEDLSFGGESGAIGRINMSNDTCSLDLRGQIYTGGLYSTASIMTLNLRTIFQDGENRMVASVDSITNEVCNLTKQSSQGMSHHQKYYSDDDDIDDKVSEIVNNTSSKKSKSTIVVENEDDDEEVASNIKAGSGTSSNKKQRRNSGKQDKSQISTITRRVRVSKDKKSKKSSTHTKK